MTPVVRIDFDRLRANIASMAASEIPLRPHVKTHKILEIARLQLAAGARGLTVATVGEAEVFADVTDDIFIAYPLWADDRLAALSRRVSLTVGCDSIEAASRLSLIDAPVPLLIEVDSGHHRSGVPVGEVDALARRILDLGLEVRGAFTFPGHSYQPGQTAASDEAAALSQAGEILRELGIRDPILSGGSTPSARAADPAVLTELRPGVYVFNDAQQLELGTCGWEDIALTVRATVVSRRVDLHQVILDAGSKILGSDRPAWASGFGRIMGVPDARVTAVSEHHGTVAWPPGEPLPAIGEEVDVIPNHVCPVLNLVDEVEVSDGSDWVVAARGKN